MAQVERDYKSHLSHIDEEEIDNELEIHENINKPLIGEIDDLEIIEQSETVDLLGMFEDSGDLINIPNFLCISQ